MADRDSAASRQALETLIMALDRIVSEIQELGKATQAGISLHAFSPYYDYRARIDAYEALQETITARLNLMPSRMREKYRPEVLDRERRLLHVTIKAGLAFFFSLSAIPTLPVGIRELFARELRAMANARQRLRSSDHAVPSSSSLEPDLDMAEAILTEVMEKAPSLRDFDAALPVVTPDPRA